MKVIGGFTLDYIEWSFRCPHFDSISGKLESRYQLHSSKHTKISVLIVVTF